jgi:hypothetical protein
MHASSALTGVAAGPRAHTRSMGGVVCSSLRAMVFRASRTMGACLLCRSREESCTEKRDESDTPTERGSENTKHHRCKTHQKEICEPEFGNEPVTYRQVYRNFGYPEAGMAEKRSFAGTTFRGCGLSVNRLGLKPRENPAREDSGGYSLSPASGWSIWRQPGGTLRPRDPALFH